jgi:hypothetical protein
MFETGTQMGEYRNGSPPSRESGWAGEEEYPGYQGEEEYPGYQGEEEYPGYQGEEEYPGYQGEEEYPGYQGEAEYPGYQGEEEYPGGPGQGEEEQFLPALIPIVGQVLGGLLGGMKREAESAGGYGEAEGEYPQGGAGEAEEQFLHKILLGALGREAEYNAAPLTAEQEDEFTGRLLEVSNEEELGRVLGGIVNAVGRAVQGVRGAVNSPQGRAIIDAVAPLAEGALTGEATGSLMEAESGEVNQEDEQYEAARRVVQLASAAAHNVATAPPGAAPQLVGELSVIRAARHFARPLFRSALGAVSPFARRYYGRRYYGGYRRGYRYGRPYGRRYYGYRRYGYRGYRPWYRYRGYGYPASYGYPPPAMAPPMPEPAPEPPPMPPGPPGPPQPGYRWVAVPIGAPTPPAEPPEPPPPPPAAPPDGAAGAPPAGAGAPAQSEYGWRRRRRRRYGRSARYGRYGRYGGGYGGGYGGDEDDDEFGPDVR